MAILKVNKIKVRTLSASLLILKAVFELGDCTLDAFFPAKYPEARMWRKILGLDSSHTFSKQTFSSTLQRLQKQGLVKCKNDKWSATALGKKLVKVSNAKEVDLPPEDGVVRLVVFDVPEKERKKRLWLRNELRAMGFELLQRSVWIGYRPLTQDFFEMLENLNLKRYVHIVGIDKGGRTGTLKVH
jgi:DNA-binding transcriptional regulator PaaX